MASKKVRALAYTRAERNFRQAISSFRANAHNEKKTAFRLSLSEKVFLLMGYSKKLYNVLGGGLQVV